MKSECKRDILSRQFQHELIALSINQLRLVFNG
ncbi:UNVERIFIED_CONTAM: hypothetical protein ABIC26_002126, partial [Paenibacillus sp. PvR008]